MSYLVSLEGNIGSGKESIVSFFKKYFTDDIVFFDDTIYNWENEELLNNFYRDPERWSFALEIYSTSQKCKRLKDNYRSCKRNKVMFTKRSPISDRECFVKACKDMNFLTDKEFEIYESIFNVFSLPKYNAILYLKSNVNKCYENIITKKGLEKNIQFKYIQTLNKFYEEWIAKLKKENIPVFVIDIEKYRDLEGNEHLQESLLSVLLNFFPFLKKYEKDRSINYKESKWTLVSNKKNKNNKLIN